MSNTTTHQRGQHLLIAEPAQCSASNGLQVSGAWIKTDYWVEAKQ